MQRIDVMPIPSDEEARSRTQADLIAAVRRIPKGRVAAYGQVARAAGHPSQARLVGRLLGNADAALPWHRVLNAQGRSSLSGSARAEQWRRLRAEGVVVKDNRVDLRRYGWLSGGDSPLLD